MNELLVKMLILSGTYSCSFRMMSHSISNQHILQTFSSQPFFLCLKILWLKVWTHRMIIVRFSSILFNMEFFISCDLKEKLRKCYFYSKFMLD